MKKDRLKFLKKQNQFRLKSPKFISRLEKECFDYKKYESVQLDDVEKLILRVRALGFDQSFSERYYIDDVEFVEKILISITPLLNNKNYFSIHKLSEYWFAKIETSFVSNKYNLLLEIDGDGFVVYDLDIANGLRLELYEHYYMYQGNRVYGSGYEIDIWGKEWISQLFSKN